MRVLFLMFAFPDMNRSFNMYTALVEQFHKHGHQVFVVAPETEDRKTAIHLERGVDVLRVHTLPIKNVSHYLKGISNVLLPFQFGRAIKKYYPKANFDLIMTPTPPITLVDLAFSLKRKHNAIHYLMLRDIFPQNAVDLGFMNKNGIIYRYFRAKEKKLYASADLIGCMSQGNIDYILSKNSEVSENKLHELKNLQVLFKETISTEKYASVRAKYNLQNRFVIVFGGNMGKPQQLSNVLELAKRCKDYTEVLFLLLGEGVAMQYLSDEIKEQKIGNIRIYGTIPKQEYQQLIAVCDLGLISLHEDYTIPNIPSKSLDYFNVGLPVLASIDKATDFGLVLEEANAGLWSYAGDHESFKNNFDVLYKDKNLRESLGKNGRAYFEKNLTPEIAYEKIINQISHHQASKNVN